MPITFYGYGRALKATRVLEPEEQAAATLAEFNRQKESGQLPSDAVWGGFFADTDKTRSVNFLHRPMGIDLCMKCQPSDRTCAAAYDRLLGSTIDATSAIEWANEHRVHLVLIDLDIDSSTEVGRKVLQALAIVKGYDREEYSRRAKKNADDRRAKGLAVTGMAPLGYKIKTIIPVSGGKPIKYYFPWVAERQYGERIVRLHDEFGLSYHRIAIKFLKDRIVKPRSQKPPSDVQDIGVFYHRCKAGWPLPGGFKWQPPQFKYRPFRDKEVIDLTRED